MNILSWNCNMAFRKKFQNVLTPGLDLAIIQECENQERLEPSLEGVNYSNLIWYGRNQHKGIAVISFGETQIELMSEFNPEYEYVIPVKCIDRESEYFVLAIWAMPHQSVRVKDYVGQIWSACHYYDQLFSENMILVGDFNSNAIWNKKKKHGNHSDVVKFLADKSIRSLYHNQTEEEHGSESQPTIYLLKNVDKPYHLDYCFCSERLINQDTQIKVGKYDDWIKHSDHMPLYISNLD